VQLILVLPEKKPANGICRWPFNYINCTNAAFEIFPIKVGKEKMEQMGFWIFFFMTIFIYVSILLFSRRLVGRGCNLLLSRVILAVIFGLEEASFLFIARYIQVNEAAWAAVFFGIIGFIVSCGKGADMLTIKFRFGTPAGMFRVSSEEKKEHTHSGIWSTDADGVADYDSYNVRIVDVILRRRFLIFSQCICLQFNNA